MGRGKAGLTGREGRTREVMVGDQDRKEVGSCSEGPENPERICWMDLEEVGKGRRSIVGVDGWVSNWDPGH